MIGLVSQFHSKEPNSKTEANLNIELAIRISQLNYWTNLDQENYVEA